MQETSLKNIRELDVGSSFMVNDSMQCTLKEPFSDWHKDINSPSEFSEVHVSVMRDGKMLDGLLVMQKDAALSQTLYAQLCMKDTNADFWQSVFTTNEITL